MINAALSSVAATVSTSIANGAVSGDMRGAFQAIFSSDTLRSVVVTALTAGALHGVGGIDVGQPFGEETLDAFASRLVNNSVRNAISSSIDTVITGDGEFGDNLLNALQSAAVLSIGATVAEQIGELRHEENLDYVSHKLAHAALGCAVAEGTGGDCAGGAIGAAAGEVVGELYFSEERQQAFANELKTSIADDTLSLEEAALKVQEWKQQGLDVARLAGALSAFVAGADVNSADTAATNATENNLCGTGACVGLAMLILAAYTYTVAEGEGDFYAGLGEIGRGEDFLSEMSAAAISYGIEGAYAVAPDTTVDVLEGLAAIGELEDAVVTYVVDSVDGATGNVISRNWNAIPEDTRYQILGGFTLATVIIPSTTVAKLAPSNVNVIGASLANLKKNWPGEVPNRVAKQADVVDHFQQNRQFWSQDPVQFNGNKVYQRNDLIDPNKIDVETGLTNQQLMAQGYAPYGPDGRKINLHHMIQKQNGAIAEMTATFHQQNSGTIHINTGRLPSGINRSQFDQWRKQYWINRANDF